MRPLCEGVPSIAHLIHVPSHVLTPSGRIRFQWLVENGVQSFLPPKYRIKGRAGSMGVPETANQDFERKCQLFDAYNQIALRTQFLVKSIRPARFAPTPWEIDDVAAQSTGTVTAYAFVPWMVARRVPSSKWTGEPACALGEAIETMRFIICTHFPTAEHIHRLPLDDEKKTGLLKVLREHGADYRGGPGRLVTTAQIVEHDVRHFQSSLQRYEDDDYDD